MTGAAIVPSITVVIPALNEEELLPACLQSLIRQTGGIRYEIVVVDNGSTDDTAAVAQRFGIRVITEGQKGVARARAAGFAAARTEIIASTDADTIVPEDWLARILGHFSKHPDITGVGGGWVYLDGPLSMRLLARFINFILPILARVAPWAWSFSGFNFAVRKKAYQSSGGFRFDLPYGEDWDLGKKIRRQGRIIIDYHLVVRTSGKAFSGDPIGIRAIINYLSLVFFGRTYLPVMMRRRSEET